MGFSLHCGNNSNINNKYSNSSRCLRALWHARCYWEKCLMCIIS